jgi:hypothetical protein
LLRKNRKKKTLNLQHYPSLDTLPELRGLYRILKEDLLPNLLKITKIELRQN